MRHAARVTMSMCELDRLKCIQAVVDGDLSPGIAANRLGITTRQLRRIAQRYRAEGPTGLISRHCSRPSNNRLDASLEDQVVKILRESYPDFGPTLASEKLQQRHGIKVAKETLRRVQMDAGLWIPRKLRPPKVQQPRARRACFGELIQIDGCEHHWFEERAPVCTALVYVDDATSRLMVVRFAGSESTFGYFEATLEYLRHFGKPLTFYCDKASIFRINQPGAVTGPGYTQFGRALYELNIDGICANTAAAKGRVERAHLTLQDRLVAELRLEGISSIEAANAFMPRFINEYNKRFAKEPRNSQYRPVSGLTFTLIGLHTITDNNEMQPAFTLRPQYASSYSSLVSDPNNVLTTQIGTNSYYEVQNFTTWNTDSLNHLRLKEDWNVGDFTIDSAVGISDSKTTSAQIGMDTLESGRFGIGPAYYGGMKRWAALAKSCYRAVIGA